MSLLTVTELMRRCAPTAFFETLDTMGTLQTWRYLLGMFTVIIGVVTITLRPDTEGAGVEKAKALEGGSSGGESRLSGAEARSGGAAAEEGAGGVDRYDNQLADSGSVRF